MATIIVKIKISRVTKAEMEQEKEAWFPQANKVSIDEMDLRRDPDEDSFFLFDLVEVKD